MNKHITHAELDREYDRIAGYDILEARHYHAAVEGKDYRELADRHHPELMALKKYLAGWQGDHGPMDEDAAEMAIWMIKRLARELD